MKVFALFVVFSLLPVMAQQPTAAATGGAQEYLETQVQANVRITKLAEHIPAILGNRTLAEAQISAMRQAMDKEIQAIRNHNSELVAPQDMTDCMAEISRQDALVAAKKAADEREKAEAAKEEAADEREKAKAAKKETFADYPNQYCVMSVTPTDPSSGFGPVSYMTFVQESTRTVYSVAQPLFGSATLLLHSCYAGRQAKHGSLELVYSDKNGKLKKAGYTVTSESAY